MAGGGITALLLLVIVAELVTVSWCALQPLYLLGQLDLLTTVTGWWELYSFALGNLDVLTLAVLKDLTLLALVLSTPTRRPKHGRDLADTSNHGKVRTAIAILCGMHAAFLLVKAAAVAVTAPEELWPAAASQGPPAPSKGGFAGRFGGGGVSGFGGGGFGGAGLIFGSDSGAVGGIVVGLVYLYVSIVVSLVCSLVSKELARALVSERQDAWESDEGREGEGLEAGMGVRDDNVRTPLLSAAAAAATTTMTGVAKGGGGGGRGGGSAAGEGESGKPLSRRAAARSKQRTLVELLRMASVDWPILLAAFSAGILAALGAALIPYLTGQIIDYASIDPDRHKFRRTLVQLIVVAALTGLFSGTRGGLFTVANTRFNVRLRRQLFHALLQFEIGFFDTTKTGEITSRLSADTSTVADQVGLNLNVLLRSATQAVMVLTFMFAACWRLTVVTFILIPVVLMISQVYGKYFSKMSKRVQAELAAANGVAEEVLSTMTTVKAHAAQDSAEAAYAAKLQGYYRLLLVEAGMYAVYALLTIFLPNLVSAVVLFYGGSLVLGGLMSPGSLVSFMLFQQSLSSAFNMMGDVYSALTAAVGAADKVIELMRRPPAIPAFGRLVLPSLEGRVELRDVVMHYPARLDVRVLNGLSLVAQPGEVVALVGPSGGGKSSIVKLLERFYLPMSGRILLDGHELGDLEPKWLRRQVALVSQEPVLYARSIRRNIVFGLEAEDGCPCPPTQQDVEEAAKLANAHDFISSFPAGYDTECGEKGVALSGGQKQRIAIARALVRRPRVLLLDEATSALDADSEAVVQEALDHVMTGRTVIVIAHRLSTIQNADRIFVIGKGVVQETGTHLELLAAGGVYAQLVRRQLSRPMSQANFLASSSDLRASVSATSLTSMENDLSQASPQQQQQKKAAGDGVSQKPRDVSEGSAGSGAGGSGSGKGGAGGSASKG